MIVDSEYTVVGSGPGGLTAAATLARAGKSVLVLEAGREFGGYMNPFRRRKFTFDVGLHYVGGLAAAHRFGEVLDACGVRERVRFVPLPPDGFDRFVFPCGEFLVPAGREVFLHRLARYFPRAASRLPLLRTLLELHAPQRQARSRLETLLTWNAAVGPDLDPAALTWGRLLELLFPGEDGLQAVLSAHTGNLGQHPAEVSATAMLNLWNHFLDGAYYPAGGSGALKEAFLAVIAEGGGTLRRRSRVVHYAFENDVWHLTTERGERFRVRRIVCNASPQSVAVSLGDVSPETEVPLQHFRRSLQRQRYSLSCVCLFVGTDLPPDRLGLGAENVWHFPAARPETCFGDFDALMAGEDVAFFLSSPTRKSPHGTLAPDGCEVLELIAFVPFEPFRQWSGTPTRQRGPAYEELKFRLQRSLLEQLERNYAPDLRNHLRVVELSTPVTNEAYVAAVDGAMYGPAFVPEQYGAGRRCDLRAPLPNFYFCGAAVYSGGISPACLSGYDAARAAVQDGDADG